MVVALICFKRLFYNLFFPIRLALGFSLFVPNSAPGLELGAVCEDQDAQPMGDALLDARLGELSRLVLHEAQPTEGVAEGAVGELLA